MRETWLACVLVLGATGCPDIKTDPGEGSDLPTVDGPSVEFDPANGILPFPNNLATSMGKVHLPAQACESPAATALREGVLNHLDGFGTFESALQVTFSEAVDPASLDGHIVVYKRATGTTAVDPATAQKLDVIAVPTTTFRFDAADCAHPTPVPAVVIVPKLPMDGSSTYVAVLTSGIKTATGQLFQPTQTWGLVRNGKDPVTFDDAGNVIANRTPLSPQDPAQLAQLHGLDLLWKAHAQGLAFVEAVGEVDRGDELVGFEFTTQTIGDPLDPTIAGSPAASVPATPLAHIASNTGNQTAPQFLAALFPGQCGANALPCDAVGQILRADFQAPNYQIATPNPTTGLPAIPGPWTDNAHPTLVGTNALSVIVSVPAAAPPPTGYPTMIFGHGLTRRKEDMYAIISQLAAQGIAVAAIDFVASGSRAIKISDSAAIGCDGVRDATKPADLHCFAPILSTNLVVTRDNIRQSALDVQALIAALKACGTDSCDTVKVDGAKLAYGGQSLGGIIGSVITGSSTSIKASVLDVPGVGLIDILEHTDSLGIRCSLVDGLIDAGVLVGDKSNLAAMPPTGLCTTQAWQMQPAYKQFSSIARWVLDPGDGANYTSKLRDRRILIQEVVDDGTVPNFATDTLGALTVGTPSMADCNALSTPSAAITTNPLTSKWLRYASQGAGTCAPVGNAFQHGSWLDPVRDNGGIPTSAGLAGTTRLQADSIAFLLANVEAP